MKDADQLISRVPSAPKAEDHTLRYSVVIPCFRAAKTLPGCLKSVAANLPDRSEVIVVDDGSHDETAVVAEQFPFKLLRLPENHGAGYARNQGIWESRGEVVVFLDADVEIDRHFFSTIEKVFRREPRADAVIGMFSNELRHRNFPSLYKHHLMRSYHARGVRWPKALLTAVTAVKRHVFDTTGGFDENIRGALTEDVELGHRLVAHGFRICFEPSLTVQHQKRYSWRSLVKTQFCRALAMGRLFITKSGLKETASTGQFLSIPLGFGLSLVWAPLVTVSAVYTCFNPTWGLIALGLAYAALLASHRHFLKSMLKNAGAGFAVGAVLMLVFDFLLAAGAGALGVLSGVFSRSTIR